MYKAARLKASAAEIFGLISAIAPFKGSFYFL